MCNCQKTAKEKHRFSAVLSFCDTFIANAIFSPKIDDLVP